ncbi:MAG TPA: PEP-CTERM sorting domain-containing protein [Burkholderiaceae bacterium]|jgi:hypothetical protein
MKFVPKSFALSALVIGLCAAAAAQAQTNLLNNGAFSTSTPNGLADGWTAVLPNTVGYTSDNTNKAYLGNDGTDWPNHWGNFGLSGTFNDTPVSGVQVYCGSFQGYHCDNTLLNGVKQTVSGLTVGNTYQLSFLTGFGSQNDAHLAGGLTAYWQASLGAQTQNGNAAKSAYEPAQYANTTYGQWVSSTLTFTATSASEVLQFLAIVPPQGMPTSAAIGLSNASLVDVTPVPEPATLALSVGGLALLGYSVRRQRKNRN